MPFVGSGACQLRLHLCTLDGCGTFAPDLHWQYRHWESWLGQYLHRTRPSLAHFLWSQDWETWLDQYPELHWLNWCTNCVHFLFGKLLLFLILLIKSGENLQFWIFWIFPDVYLNSHIFSGLESIFKRYLFDGIWMFCFLKNYIGCFWKEFINLPNNCIVNDSHIELLLIVLSY